MRLAERLRAHGEKAALRASEYAGDSPGRGGKLTGHLAQKDYQKECPA
jgi:hypothetical protein